MATDFTPNYNLDKYTATDKPNLRDQYNAAMDKIDLALLSANTNATEAKAATQSFENRITQNETAISTERTARENADTQINAAISTERTARENADKQINAAIGNFTSANVVMLGNSFTDGVGDTNGGIFNRCKNLFAHCYKFTGSGTGFLPYGDSAHQVTFYNLLNMAINSSAFSNSSIDYIVINGAWGDSNGIVKDGYDVSQFETDVDAALSMFVSTAKSAFTNLKGIVYIWCEGRYLNVQQTSAGTSCIETPFAVHNIFKWLLPKRGISYLGWAGWSLMFQDIYFTNDGIHPNQYGYTKLAAAYTSIITGNIDYEYRHPQSSGINPSFILDFGNCVQGMKVGIYADYSPDNIFYSVRYFDMSDVPANYTHANVGDFFEIPILNGDGSAQGNSLPTALARMIDTYYTDVNDLLNFIINARPTMGNKLPYFIVRVGITLDMSTKRPRAVGQLLTGGNTLTGVKADDFGNTVISFNSQFNLPAFSYFAKNLAV